MLDGGASAVGAGHRGVARVLRGAFVDVSAGVIVGSIAIAYCVGFSALIFQGDLRPGLSAGLWSMLVGTAICSALIGWMTSIRPIAANMEASTVGMLKALALTVLAAGHAAGASRPEIVAAVLMAIPIATLASGAMLYIAGVLELGQSMRFVPSPVTGGFLGATGMVLFLASIKLATGQDIARLDLASLPGSVAGAKLMAAAALFLSFVVARRVIKSVLLLPIGFLVGALVVNVGAVMPATAPWFAGWFPQTPEPLVVWFPFAKVYDTAVAWPAVLRAVPDIVALAIVMIVTLVVRTSGLEVALGRRADFNTECRAHGIANMVAGLAGGTASAAASGTSRLVYDLGSRSVVSSLVVSLCIAAILVANFDIAHFLPEPLLAALLLIVGWGLMANALSAPVAQRRWAEVSVIVLIVVIALQFGFPSAVVAGFAVSCLMFAVSYSRVGIVRRHMTRATFAGNVLHTPDVERFLRDNGKAIHLYWLTGYIFFGSSDRLFEQIRSEIERQSEPPVSFLVLDLAGVSGLDTAAALSLAKLGAFCNERGIRICYSSVPDDLAGSLATAGLTSGTAGRLFRDYNDAIAWCEAELLRDRDAAFSDDAFELWISSEVGASTPVGDLLGYLSRREVPVGGKLYAQGEAADTIELIADGVVAVTITDALGRPREIRRMARRTVVGEMGFFRHQTRTADVVAVEPVTAYTLSRLSFDRMRREDPALAQAFLVFIVRALADRLEFANGEIAGLIVPAVWRPAGKTAR